MLSPPRGARGPDPSRREGISSDLLSRSAGRGSAARIEGRPCERSRSRYWICPFTTAVAQSWRQVASFAVHVPSSGIGEPHGGGIISFLNRNPIETSDAGPRYAGLKSSVQDGFMPAGGAALRRAATPALFRSRPPCG